MSIWSDNPEWFDAWIENRAARGDFGPEIQAKVNADELLGYHIWSMKGVDPNGELAAQAIRDYADLKDW